MLEMFRGILLVSILSIRVVSLPLSQKYCSLSYRVFNGLLHVWSYGLRMCTSVNNFYGYASGPEPTLFGAPTLKGILTT